MSDSLVHYRVELPVGTPEQWAIHGPGWTDLHIREGTSDVDVLHEVWIDDVYRLRGLDLMSTTEVYDLESEDGSIVETHAVPVGKTIIDLGANTGIFSALALQFGVARVIAVEPEPANIELLRRNLEPWSAQGQVTIIEGAVGGETGKTLVIGEAGTAHTDPTTGKGALVDQMTLETIIDAVTTSVIALLKVDIEGAEFETICACPSEHLARVQQIAMEWHGEGEALHLGPDDGRYGRLLTHLAQTHAVQVFGRPDVGGYLFAHAYG